MGRFHEQMRRDKIEDAAIFKRRALRAPLAAKSAQEYKQSGLGKILEGFSHIDMNDYNSEYQISHDHWVYILVSRDYSGAGITNKVVHIAVTPDGLIKIKGGLFGSTSLSKNQWQGEEGKDVLKKALSKAYRHPKSEPYEPQAPPCSS